MLKINTKVAESLIPGAGKGLFAAQFIPKNTVVWEFDATIDKTVTDAEADSLPPEEKTKFALHAYHSKKMGLWVVCGDDAKFMNHSDAPNLISQSSAENPEDVDVAAVDIYPGEEIVCNYFDFDEDADRKLSAPTE